MPLDVKAGPNNKGLPNNPGCGSRTCGLVSWLYPGLREAPLRRFGACRRAFGRLQRESLWSRPSNKGSGILGPTALFYNPAKAPQAAWPWALPTGAPCQGPRPGTSVASEPHLLPSPPPDGLPMALQSLPASPLPFLGEDGALLHAPLPLPGVLEAQHR